MQLEQTAAPLDAPSLNLSWEGAVAVVRLNRPSKANAYDAEMLEALERLDLSRCPIGAAGLVAVASALVALAHQHGAERGFAPRPFRELTLWPLADPRASCAYEDDDGLDDAWPVDPAALRCALDAQVVLWRQRRSHFSSSGSAARAAPGAFMV